ncbi:predicted protein [Nematostella vectensis]|uniref:Endonuclease/exonuclease/phosphatase domain-containing protein n=1 Tax=Nematostella vectensis TaxID=45351 RepID=A7T913_NEMVE|nr:predicted protein [Nematostella vectensis]|eukprot:XP_001619620.1 hypothetical protein NEMVEDRAFT_v1g224008 [Nematostella vectensis]
MADYIKPLIRKKPESIVLHIGTNDLRDSEPHNVADGVVDLAHQIESADISVAVSGLITRSDSEELTGRVKETNRLLRSFCNQNGFSETRLDDTYTDAELKIHGYDISRKDRNRDGGGVCVYIRSSINCVNRKEIVPEDVEAVCLEIRKPNSRPFIVSVVYRPESPIEYFNRFEELIKAVDDEDKEHVILGDLNCCLLKKKVFDNKTKKLKSIYEAYQLSQLINEPTRITIDSKSLIDHFVTSSPDKINSSGVIHIGPSDHSLIYGIRKINPYRCARDKAKTIEIRNFKHFDQQKFVKDLLTQSWEQIVLCHDTNEMWAHWKDLFLNVLDRHAPVQSKRKKH